MNNFGMVPAHCSCVNAKLVKSIKRAVAAKIWIQEHKFEIVEITKAYSVDNRLTWCVWVSVQGESELREVKVLD